MLVNQDCLEYLKSMKEESIQMIYLDPPFYTQEKQILSDKNGFQFSFDDRWQNLDEYLLYLQERLTECKKVLKKNGTIFLHCDSKASHYLKVLMDKVFGYDNFRSEIIWTYKRWSNSKKGLLNTHQKILFYSKSSEFKFNTIFTNYSPTTNIDQILQDRVRNEKGKSIYKTDDNGDIVFSTEKKGVPLSDVWEIPFLNPKAKERIGYPTQKPILLLERIIEISTDINDFILDPFCGSGTTLVAAQLLNRKYIGVDISATAIELCQKRLENPIKTNSRLLEVGDAVYSTKNDLEKKILSNFECDIVQRNKGIDAILRKKYDNKPVAIKIQKSYEVLQESINLLYQAGNKKNCSYTILIRINDSYELLENSIPANMILIDSYEYSINKALKEGAVNIIPLKGVM